MKKIVLIPDSFKGSLNSGEICNIMKACILRHYPECQVVEIPVADGGEGSVESFLTVLGGQRIELEVTGPYFEKVKAFYGLLPGGHTAVIEMAACAGLPLVEGRKNPLKTTTYGVGELMAHAAGQGVKQIILGLGGSCTNDAGAGAAAALGVRFYNKDNETFVPVGGTLREIERIDASGLLPLLRKVELLVMCDVDNPLYGPTGAAYVFGPQKGADPQMVEELNGGLCHISEKLQQELGIRVVDIKGGGAAGGMGAGAVAFFGAQLRMGIDVVLDTVGFETIAESAELIFTGEGRIDYQSLRGKVVVGVAKRARSMDIPVIAVVGEAADGIEDIYELGVSAIFSINRRALPLQEAITLSRSNLEKTMDNLMRLIKMTSILTKKKKLSEEQLL